MQGKAEGPIWLPPIQVEWIAAGTLIVIGANIEKVPTEYHEVLSNSLVFLVGMLIAAGLASLKLLPLAMAVAFFLVNLVRLLPKKELINPGKKEGFAPSGTLDWVTTQKQWFVEKVLFESPVAIQEKEVVTYPIHS